eukprot:1002161-Pleurochrysis_carterae.AAC.3
MMQLFGQNLTRMIRRHLIERHGINHAGLKKQARRLERIRALKLRAALNPHQHLPHTRRTTPPACPTASFKLNVALVRGVSASGRN